MYSVIKNPTAEQIGNEALRISMRRVGNTKNNVNEYIADAVAEKLCRDNPQLLTLEELEQMVGDAVYGKHTKQWYIIFEIEECQDDERGAKEKGSYIVIKMTDGEDFEFDKDEDFYRHKPGA